MVTVWYCSRHFSTSKCAFGKTMDINVWIIIAFHPIRIKYCCILYYSKLTTSLVLLNLTLYYSFFAVRICITYSCGSKLKLYITSLSLYWSQCFYSTCVAAWLFIDFSSCHPSFAQLWRWPCAGTSVCPPSSSTRLKIWTPCRNSSWIRSGSTTPRPS